MLHPVSSFLDLLFLIKKVEVELGHLEKADIAVGIQAGRKFYMIFHNRDLLTGQFNTAMTLSVNPKKGLLTKKRP